MAKHREPILIVTGGPKGKGKSYVYDTNEQYKSHPMPKKYKKHHASKAAADKHVEKIKKRGGKHCIEPHEGGYLVVYEFSNKK